MASECGIRVRPQSHIRAPLWVSSSAAACFSIFEFCFNHYEPTFVMSLFSIVKRGMAGLLLGMVFALVLQSALSPQRSAHRMWDWGLTLIPHSGVIGLLL